MAADRFYFPSIIEFFVSVLHPTKQTIETAPAVPVLEQQIMPSKQEMKIVPESSASMLCKLNQAQVAVHEQKIASGQEVKDAPVPSAAGKKVVQAPLFLPLTRPQQSAVHVDARARLPIAKIKFLCCPRGLLAQDDDISKAINNVTWHLSELTLLQDVVPPLLLKDFSEHVVKDVVCKNYEAIMDQYLKSKAQLKLTDRSAVSALEAKIGTEIDEFYGVFVFWSRVLANMVDSKFCMIAQQTRLFQEALYEALKYVFQTLPTEYPNFWNYLDPDFKEGNKILLSELADKIFHQKNIHASSVKH